MRTIRQFAYVAFFTVAASVVAAAPAMAQPDIHEQFHLTFTDTFPACGATVSYDQTLDSQLVSDTHPDGTVHATVENRSEILWTNTDTGKTLTEKFIFNNNTRLIPDAEGQTLVAIFPQNDQWFDAGGNLVGHLAGIARNVIVFDQHGDVVSVTSISNGNVFNNSTDFCTLIDLTK
jgi:hypothetical protein